MADEKMRTIRNPIKNNASSLDRRLERIRPCSLLPPSIKVFILDISNRWSERETKAEKASFPKTEAAVVNKMWNKLGQQQSHAFISSLMGHSAIHVRGLSSLSRSGLFLRESPNFYFMMEKAITVWDFPQDWRCELNFKRLLQNPEDDLARLKKHNTFYSVLIQGERAKRHVLRQRDRKNLQFHKRSKFAFWEGGSVMKGGWE